MFHKMKKIKLQFNKKWRQKHKTKKKNNKKTTNENEIKTNKGKKIEGYIFLLNDKIK